MTLPRAIFPDCPKDLKQFILPRHLTLVPELELPIDPLLPEARSQLLAGYQACMLYVLKVSDQVMAAHPALKSIVYLSTGAANHVDIPAAERRGIGVRNVPRYSTRSVAEHAIGLMFAAMRQTVAMDRSIRGDRWRQLGGLELQGRTLGVVGLGEIGRETAMIGHVLGMRVVAWNRQPRQGAWTLMELDELLACSDIVSLHTALTPETEGLLDRRRIGLMKKGAVLVNVSRGKLVDEIAMIEALQTGHLRHAALDVFTQEPLPSKSPLVGMDNVTLTTHSAWYTAEAAQRLFDASFLALREELDRIAAGASR